MYVNTGLSIHLEQGDLEASLSVSCLGRADVLTSPIGLGHCIDNSKWSKHLWHPNLSEREHHLPLCSDIYVLTSQCDAIQLYMCIGFFCLLDVKAIECNCSESNIINACSGNLDVAVGWENEINGNLLHVSPLVKFRVTS